MNDAEADDDDIDENVPVVVSAAVDTANDEPHRRRCRRHVHAACEDAPAAADSSQPVVSEVAVRDCEDCQDDDDAEPPSADCNWDECVVVVGREDVAASEEDDDQVDASDQEADRDT